MATGLEAAGLVLGSIPLILAGLQFYLEGIGVTKRYWKYREEINSLLIEVRAENCQFINTINWLLIGVVDQKDLAVFLADPGGERWKEEKFDRRLRKRLDSSYESYLETTTQLVNTMQIFSSRLKLNSAGKAQFLDTNTFKENYKRLRFSRKKRDYAKYSDAVRRCIRCDFDKRASSLEDVQFQKAVYQKVVAQLQENYDYLFQQDPE